MYKNSQPCISNTSNHKLTHTHRHSLSLCIQYSFQYYSLEQRLVPVAPLWRCEMDHCDLTPTHRGSIWTTDGNDWFPLPPLWQPPWIKEPNFFHSFTPTKAINITPTRVHDLYFLEQWRFSLTGTEGFIPLSYLIGSLMIMIWCMIILKHLEGSFF